MKAILLLFPTQRIYYNSLMNYLNFLLLLLVLVLLSFLVILFLRQVIEVMVVIVIFVLLLLFFYSFLLFCLHIYFLHKKIDFYYFLDFFIYSNFYFDGINIKYSNSIIFINLSLSIGPFIIFILSYIFKQS